MDVETKHPEYYFSDGSIVLRLGKTLFKIHQSILGRHSDIFAGMWDMPQPDGEELVDGCPVVDLQDDVDDFTDTLRAVYDSFHFDTLNTSTASLGELVTFVNGILKISTKYSMAKLRQKCISLLLVKLPNTFESCCALLHTKSKYDSPDIIRVINLARAANVPEILPWAFYLCTHMSVNDIMKNTVLSWQDKAIVLAGRERLWEVQKSTSNSALFVFTPSQQCTSNCQGRILAAIPGTSISTGNPPGLNMGMNYREAEDYRRSPHPLGEFDGWSHMKQQPVCGRCSSHQIAEHKKGREKVWNNLPTYFDLGTWEDIKKDQYL
ncbi:hypothetical protein FA15DRAFT_681809 [Coprinopsis marcescibilis]|uniref:BTB domain-containing protein n=1 Tax=Coprinopsis marcescibilis TaxID=230819 RepID=A0A5C3KNM7_COPMA|nr:hypothetical protein FA15DRAFT_681809 [Coprinopsis marcescibilis]